MIYLVEKYCDMAEHFIVDSVWEISSDKVEQDYQSFMRGEATGFNIVINPHYLNIMNHKDHHPKLSAKEYKAAEKSWNKHLKKWPIERYIKEILGGVELKFETLHS